jgi:hypothetical protein
MINALLPSCPFSEHVNRRTHPRKQHPELIFAIVTLHIHEFLCLSPEHFHGNASVCVCLHCPRAADGARRAPAIDVGLFITTTVSYNDMNSVALP